jgi:hypothetical protein
LRLAVPDVYGCRKVSIAGDMTAWVQIDMPFDGQQFAIELVVPRDGRWRYRFCLDDAAWVNDPDADDFETYGDGGAVSVRYS